MKCLILAGGSGDRLWPLSRRSYPKQFVEIKENRSFMQETILRNMPFCDEFLIVTNKKYRFIVEGQLQAFQGLKCRCYFEEESKGTAVPVALINFLQNPSEILLVTASDIAVGVNGYRESILNAVELARGGAITALGVPITEPSTRYGYIKFSSDNVEQYIEKPNQEEADDYAKNDNYLWNSGIFLARSESFLNELENLQPDIYNKCYSVGRKLKQRSNELFFDEGLLKDLPNISIEKALFEKSANLKVVRALFDWKDMDGLTDVLPFTKRDEKNTIVRQCDGISVLNRTNRQLVVADNVSDIMIINTPDVVYVSGRQFSEDNMRDLVDENIEEYHSYFEQGEIVYRPWGHYEVLSHENGFKIKKVTVFPGKHISFHKHEYRSEHWSIVSGTARIILDGVERDFFTNESIYVEKGIEHRVSNPSDENLIIVEVGIGEQLTESDTKLLNENVYELDAIKSDSIVKLEPAYKDYMWGGNRLRDVFGKKCDYEIIAESWELSAHPDGQSVISKGAFKGMLFGEYLRRIGKDRLGWKAELYEEFPVLIKLIDASKPLSIQVHPDDDFAFSHEGEYGKNEMWHIIDCDKDSYIYCGFREDVTKDEVVEAIENNSLERLLNKYYVSVADTIFIPTGTVHAIGAGILLCEIQQSSNSTYRIYDYGRRDKYGRLRKLHLDKAMQVIDTAKWNNENITVWQGEKIEGGLKQSLARCKYFETIRYNVNDEIKIMLDEASFSGIIIIEGNALLRTEDLCEEASAGDTFFLPAGKTCLTVEGKCSLLFTKI